MKTIALNRLNLLAIPRGNGWSAQQKVMFLAELGKMGYRLSNPVLLDQASEVFLMDYKYLMEVLRKKKGGNVKYVPLFKNFPNDIPEDNSYFLKRIFGYLGNVLSLFEDGVELQNGVKVPKWLFNIYEFGADPITQMQSRELFDLAVRENSSKPEDTNIEWVELTIVFEEELQEELRTYLKDLVYSRSAIKEELHTDLSQLINFFGVEELDGDLIVFKETKALVLAYLWEQGDYAAIEKLTGNAIDVLRMFASLTGTDVSLSENIKFPKLSRKERKVILGILEHSANLSEDLKNYKGLWLEIGRYIHPSEYAKQFPATAEVFDALRNGKIETYGSKTERFLLLNQVNSLLKHLNNKPGVFARKLHEVLRRFPGETEKVLRSFESIIAKLEVKNLLMLRSYFNTINEEEYRTIVNKKGKIKVIPNNAFAELTEGQIEQILEIIDRGLCTKLAKKDSWVGQKIWIDPGLNNYTVPLQQRKASDGIITVGRGSRIKVDFDKVLRLFVYWKEADQRTDLDLSVIQYDEYWNCLGHVSYTNLRSNGIVHSGDIQSAPHGAAEFIDITLKALPSEVKYLAPQVHKYCGNNFIEMDCHAGWMLRKDVNANMKTFDIKTVENKFDLNGVGGYAIPVIVDIENAEMVITDLYVSGRNFYNNVEGSKDDVSLLCSQVTNFVNTRPNMLELATFNATGRDAEIIDDQEGADITFGVQGCTYNATDVEKVLAELI
ncbi:TerD family protein [Fulvivirga sp. M361]|uniref:TerD family protein n=1 Tax=Fulvivirga sp. M361 TaxID=2594266 RepID=UPI001179DC8F|nr:TerD family protein [Fulvivirga sp. M361]TRX62561.1 TerD family protein [Fulvivirga sp. M361]